MTKIFASFAVLALASASFAAVDGLAEVKGLHRAYSHAQENDVVVFNNLESTATTGFSRAKTENPTYGAALTLAQGGRLQEIYFSIFNSTSGTPANTGSITGGVMTLNIYDNTTPYSGSGAITNPVLATISANLDYSADPLPAGFYLTDGFTGLNSLNIVLPQNVIVTQTFAQTGTSTRNGYVAFAPDLVGSSDGTVFLSSSALAPGYYNLGTSPNFVDATPGYYIVVPEPTSLAALSLGGLVLRRRRA